MDYKKIGEFIANERKAKKLTQAKLAEKLFVSEKTISKWENGNGVPSTDTLQKLCEIFNVSVNEILNGERISDENYVGMAEGRLLELKKAKEQSDKRLLNIEIVLGIVAVLSFLTILSLCIYAITKLKLYTIPIILMVVSFLLFIVAMVFCIHIEQKAGYYECEKCHNHYIPTYNQVLWSMHIGRTRYMKCPHCKQKSWNKKVIK